MSRRPTFVASTIAFSLLVAACGSGNSSDNGTSGACDKDGKIVVGEARAQTGDFAFFDVVSMNGNQLAIDQFNTDGGLLGCQMTVVDGDTKGDPALGGRVANDLIGKGAQILFSPSDFDVGVAAAQAGEKAGLVGTSEASAVAMPDAVGPHFFAAGITEEGLGLAEADFANEKGWKNAYVVTNEQFSFFTNIEKFFKTKFAGNIVARDVVADTQTDYSAVISKIAAAKDTDVIFLNDYFPHVGTFIKQLRDAGIETPVLGNNSYSSLDFPDVVGKTRMSQVYYASPVFWEGKDLDPDVQKVLDAYKAKFGKAPDNNNFMEGYDSALLLLDGVKTAGTMDADKVAAAINAQHNVKLPGATLTKWVDRHTQRTLVIIGFDDQGNFIQVKAPFDPEAGS
ncbi:MAG TPA: ABC transporter substrate-binding protein [Actinomycetota bacterium]|nr:ABC transporter substrate-binding protein [Actinomycetota bacterium]